MNGDRIVPEAGGIFLAAPVLVLALWLMIFLAGSALAGDCIGLPRDAFERRISAAVTKTADAGTAPILIDLWNAGDRLDLPASPNEIVVYRSPLDAVPLIVGYHIDQCTIAYLAIDPTEMLRWMSVNWRGV